MHAIPRGSGLAKAQRDVAQVDAELAHRRPVEHDLIVQAVHPVVELELDGLAVHGHPHGVAKADGVARLLAFGHADDVGRAALETPAAQVLELPDPALFLAIAVGEILFQHATVAAPAALHRDREALDDAPRAVREHAVRLHGAGEVATE